MDAEQELDKGNLTPEVIVKNIEGFEAAISTEAWLYFDVNWWPLTEWPVLLQIYPEENRWTQSEIAQKQAACVRRARSVGFTYVGVTYPTYHEQGNPEWYDLSGTYSLYTADDANGKYQSWAPTI